MTSDGFLYVLATLSRFERCEFSSLTSFSRRKMRVLSADLFSSRKTRVLHLRSPPSRVERREFSPQPHVASTFTWCAVSVVLYIQGEAETGQNVVLGYVVRETILLPFTTLCFAGVLRSIRCFLCPLIVAQT
jgi:hypothetical protein